MRILLLSLVVISLNACASVEFKIDGVDDAQLVDSVVYVEPVSEVAELETRSQAIPAGNVTVYQTWQEKPFLAKSEVRRKIFRKVLSEAGQNYRSTAEMADTGNDVVITRITVLEHRVAKTNQTLQAVACGLGIMCPPIWLYHLTPVKTDEEVVINAQTFIIPAGEITSRLINMPGSSGMVNTNGIIPLSSRELSATLTITRGFLNFSNNESAYLDAVMPLFLDALSGAARREQPPARGTPANDANPSTALEY